MVIKHVSYTKTLKTNRPSITPIIENRAPRRMHHTTRDIISTLSMWIARALSLSIYITVFPRAPLLLHVPGNAGRASVLVGAFAVAPEKGEIKSPSGKETRPQHRRANTHPSLPGRVRRSRRRTRSKANSKQDQPHCC